jgi:nucleoside-diphosphate-sugar epimerase
MKVIVTGATGHLGVHVVEALVAGGHEVIAASRSGCVPQVSSGAAPGGLLRGLLLELGHDGAVSTLRTQLTPGSALVHLAAHRPDRTTTVTDRERLLAINTHGTLRVLEAARRGLGGLHAVIYACDAEVYGPAEAGELLDEESRLCPATDYAASKLSGEDHLFAFEFEEQTRCISLRLGALYGPRRRAQSLLSSLLLSGGRGTPLKVSAHAQEIRARVHVRDAVSAIERALLGSVRGRFNVADGHARSLEREVRLALEIGGASDAVIFEAPATRPLNLVLDLRRARDELGFTPRLSLAEGLREEARLAREAS